MSFTVKYRSYRLSCARSADTYPDFVPHEQLSGPFAMISQEVENGNVVIYCHDEHGDSRMMIGPWCPSEGTGPEAPRPTVWAMNAAGATVAKYDL